MNKILQGLVSGMFMLATGLSGLVFAQMRDNLPQVMTSRQSSKPLPDFRPILARFQQQNKIHNRPRIVIFWNRTLTDNVATRYRKVQTNDQQVRGSESMTSDETKTDFGNANFRQLDSLRQNKGKNITETQKVVPNMRKSLVETSDWRLEHAFSRIFLETGANLIDRAIIIRNSGKTIGDKERINEQRIEISALLGKADILMEVLMAETQGSPTDISFRVTLKEINTGQIMANIVTPAMPSQPLPESRYVADESGFTLVTHKSPKPSIEQIGKQLAVETMLEIIRFWH